MTTRPELPLRVLGLLAPILSWVEGAQAEALPKSWKGEPENPFTELSDPDRSIADAASFQERSWLLGELPTYSLDNVEELVAFSRNQKPRPGDSKWSPSLPRLIPPRGYNLCSVFNGLTQRYLVWSGGKVAIRAGRMIELHELGLRLPLAFMVRHTHARAVAAGERALEDVVKLPESINLLPSNSHGMRAVIRRGLSEGHLHLNAIHAAESSWADHLLKDVKDRPARFETVEWRLFLLGRASARTLALATALSRSPGAGDQVEGGQLKELLVALDALYFSDNYSMMKRHRESFENIFTELIERIQGQLFRVADQWPTLNKDPNSPKKGIYRQNKPVGYLGLLHWLDPWRQKHKFAPNSSGGSYRRIDTLHQREECLSNLHLAAHIALIESNFLESSHSNEDREASPYAGISSFLHQSLFRYLVCQTHFWQLAVQQGKTTGLRRFKLFYDSNQRWPILASQREEADSVLRRAREWRGLRVLEGRVGPPDEKGDLLPWLEAFAHGLNEERIEKMGLVVHFIKEPDPTRSGLNNGLFRPRFAELRSTYRQQAFNLFRILERPHLVTPFIVGIDAANLELATPPEVFAPVFRFLRDRPIALRSLDNVDLDALTTGDTVRRLIERRRLGMTYHVGEEFRHLLSGLRNIAEVLEFLDPQPGDRIGHGTALGLDPEVWLGQVGYQTLIPKQEWLDTLVWLLHLLGPGDDILGRLEVETTIERLGRDLYNQAGEGHAITPLVLNNVWLLRQLDPESLELNETSPEIRLKPLRGDDSASWRWNKTTSDVLEQVLEQVGISPPVKLLASYWYSPRTRAKGEELQLVDMEEDSELWLKACEKAQKLLQDRVARNQIVVEVNPSVNRVVGPMGRFSEHHIFRLSMDNKNRWERRLRLTVNTDNPGTANTSLTHEYFLLGEAMLEHGMAESEMVEWLEWLRKTGEESSFVRQLPNPKDDHRMRLLLDRIKQKRRPLRDLKGPDACLEELWTRWSPSPG